MIVFDLEVSTWPENGNWDGEPPGISCAAAAHWVGGNLRIITWGGVNPRMTEAEVGQMVTRLDTLAFLYGPLYTWNGTAFDFRVMATECPSKKDKIVNMMLNHYDGMLMVTAKYGYWLALDAVAKGFRVPRKVKQVRLNNGTLLTNMTGGKAPELWQQGEYSAVLEYLKGDVVTTWMVANRQARFGRVSWYSKKGYLVSKAIDFVPVWSLPDSPTEDVSWMKTPPKSKQDAIAWV